MAGTAATALNFLYLQETSSSGGLSLKSAGLETASTQGTAVLAGKGKFKIVITVSAVETATGDEGYGIDIEANTADATTTWKRLATVLHLGAAAVTGRQNADTAMTYCAIVENPYDYQIRYTSHVVGTIATGFNATIKAYPVI